MSNKVHLLKEDDVVTTSSSSLMYQCTFKVSEYLAIIQTKLEAEKLLDEGLECQILRPTKPWIKGKIKLRLEFEIDEEETETLDEITDGDKNQEENGNEPNKSIPAVPLGPNTTTDQNNFENFLNKPEGMWS